MDGWQRNHRVHIYLYKQINKEYNPNSFLLFTLHILQITFCVTASCKGEELLYLFTTLHHSSHQVILSSSERDFRDSWNRNKAQVNFNKALRKLYLRLKPNSKKA